jgi:hypothetical protein
MVAAEGGLLQFPVVSDKRNSFTLPGDTVNPHTEVTPDFLYVQLRSGVEIHLGMSCLSV